MKVLQSIANPREVHILFRGGRRTHKVGRISEVHTPVKESGVSRQNTILVDLPGDNILAVDMGSTNGTSVNGEKLKIADEVEVKPKDIIKFASQAYRYKLLDKLPRKPIDRSDKTELL